MNNTKTGELIATIRKEKGMTQQNIPDELSIQVLQSEKRTRKKFIVVCVTSIFLLIAVVLYGWGPAIFQRGNPIPYLAAIIRIDVKQPYIEVRNNSGIYISKQGECPELFEYIEEHWEVELVEQAGSGYIFTNGIANLIVSSEIYWGKFTVWQVPQITLQDK